MSKVIDIRGRLKSNTGEENNTKPGGKAIDTAPVLDMSKKRTEIILAERRKVKRTILTEFIGAFVVVPQKGLCKVALYDISEGGVGFDMQAEHGGFNLGDEIPLRIYLNKTTYFYFYVKIANIRFIDEDACYRHGAHFAEGTINDVALHHFIKFIENVSASLESDKGDIIVSNVTNR